MNYEFNVRQSVRDCIFWIQDWFDVNGSGCVAVIGISGGKDSTIAGKLLTEALGKHRVVGVIMPNGFQEDKDVAYEVADYLGIKCFEINIGNTYNALIDSITEDGAISLSDQAKINLSPRIRMATLYAVSQSLNGRVCNTCNYSEDYVGYSTRYGDSVGDFSPISDFTVTEVKEIGRFLEVPDKFINKVPSDGLCGKTDEDNLGFTYEVLDKYIREGIEPDKDIKYIIDTKHEQNKFKLKYMDCFKNSKEV
jgi:NAD+ synthase